MANGTLQGPTSTWFRLNLKHSIKLVDTTNQSPNITQGRVEQPNSAVPLVRQRISKLELKLIQS